MGTTATVPSSSLAGGDEEEQIRSLIDRYWTEWVRAGDPPDPGRTEFLQLLTGDSRQREVADLQKDLSLGEARRLPTTAQFTHATKSVTVTGDSATALECVVDDSQQVESQSGKVLNGAIVTYELEKHVVRENGAWLLESSRIVTQTEGAAPCGA